MMFYDFVSIQAIRGRRQPTKDMVTLSREEQNTLMVLNEVKERNLIMNMDDNVRGMALELAWSTYAGSKDQGFAPGITRGLLFLLSIPVQLVICLQGHLTLMQYSVSNITLG